MSIPRKSITRWTKDVIDEMLIKVCLSTSDPLVLCSFKLGSSGMTVVKKVEQKIVVNRFMPDWFWVFLAATTQLVMRRGMRMTRDQMVE